MERLDKCNIHSLIGGLANQKLEKVDQQQALGRLGPLKNKVADMPTGKSSTPSLSKKQTYVAVIASLEACLRVMAWAPLSIGSAGLSERSVT